MLHVARRDDPASRRFGSDHAIVFAQSNMTFAAERLAPGLIGSWLVAAAVGRRGNGRRDTPPRQASDAPASGQAETRRELRRETQGDLRANRRHCPAAGQGDQPASEADDEQLALLRSIDAVEFHHQSLLEQQAQLETELADADKRLAKLDEFAPNEPKPYSFLLLEGLKDQLAEQQREETALKTDLKSAEQLLAAAHDELDKAAQRRAAAARRRRARAPRGGAKASRLPRRIRPHTHEATTAGQSPPTPDTSRRRNAAATLRFETEPTQARKLRGGLQRSADWTATGRDAGAGKGGPGPNKCRSGQAPAGGQCGAAKTTDQEDRRGREGRGVFGARSRHGTRPTGGARSRPGSSPNRGRNPLPPARIASQACRRGVGSRRRLRLARRPRNSPNCGWPASFTTRRCCCSINSENNWPRERQLWRDRYDLAHGKVSDERAASSG